MTTLSSDPFAKTWGLTGGIASGKSTAARFFEEEGIPVIDADQISKELSSPGGAAYDAVLKRFGTADRAELRKLVFNQPQAKSDLEQILHPLIREESLRRIKSYGPRLVIYEAALLVETGRYRDFKGLIVIDSPREERKRRVMSRDGGSEALSEKILNSQTSDQSRIEAATHVIDNSGSVAALRQKILELIPLL